MTPARPSRTKPRGASTVTPSVRAESNEQCRGLSATSASDGIAPAARDTPHETNSRSSRSKIDEPDSKPSADLPSARRSLVSKLHLPSDYDSCESDDRSSIEEYGVVRSIHSRSTLVEQVRTDVPAADSSLPAYCLTCSCTHDPPSQICPLLAVRVTEQTIKNGLRTSSFCYDEVRSQVSASNSDAPASNLEANHSNHSKNCSNSKIFEEFQSANQNFTTAHLPEQLEAQYDRQFNEFTNSLYHALREYDPVRAESILFNTKTPSNDPPNLNLPPQVPESTPYTNPPQNTYTPYFIPEPEELLQSPIEPSEPSSSDSSSTSSTSSWDTCSSSTKKKSKKKGGKKKKKQKKHKKSKKNKPFHPGNAEYETPDTTPWSPQEFKQALLELLTYDWDMTGLHILSLYKNDEVLLFHTLHRHRFKMEQA